MKLYIIDSCALMAFILGEPEQMKVELMLRRASQKEIKLIMPCLQYGEILYLILKKDTQQFEYIKHKLIELPIVYIDINRDMAQLAASFKAQRGISYADCFVIAAAIQMNGTILTKYPEFRKFEQNVPVDWL